MSPKKENKKSKDEIVIQTMAGKIVYVLSQAEEQSLPSQKAIAVAVAELEKKHDLFKGDVPEKYYNELEEDERKSKKKDIYARAKQIAPTISSQVRRMATDELGILDVRRTDTVSVDMVVTYDEAIEKLGLYNIYSIDPMDIHSRNVPQPSPSSSGSIVPQQTSSGGGLDVARRNLMAKNNWLFNRPPEREDVVNQRQMPFAMELSEWFRNITDTENPRAILGIDGAITRAVMALRAGRDVTLYGPPGTGKSTIMEHLAELFGVRIDIYSVDQSWTPEKLTVGLAPHVLVHPQEGLRLGAFLKSVGRPEGERPKWLGLDEMNRGDVGTYVSPILLATSLGYIRADLLTDRNIYVPNDFRIVATINVGDEGTKRMPSAWRRRTAFVYIPFPPEVIERRLLVNGKGAFEGLRSVDALPEANWDANRFASYLVNFAWTTRLNTALKVGVSTASLLRISEEMVLALLDGTYGERVDGEAIQLAFADAFLNEVPYQIASEGNTEDLKIIYQDLLKSGGEGQYEIAMRRIGSVIDMVAREERTSDEAMARHSNSRVI